MQLSSINQQTTTAGEVLEKRKPLCIIDGNANLSSHCGKQYEVSSALKMELPYDPVTPLLEIYQKKSETLI